MHCVMGRGTHSRDKQCSKGKRVAQFKLRLKYEQDLDKRKRCVSRKLSYKNIVDMQKEWRCQIEVDVRLRPKLGLFFFFFMYVSYFRILLIVSLHLWLVASSLDECMITILPQRALGEL